MTRDERKYELQALKSTAPERLVALYRDALGVDLHSQLPSGIGFGGMIDAIIEHELAAGELLCTDLQSAAA